MCLDSWFRFCKLSSPYTSYTRWKLGGKGAEHENPLGRNGGREERGEMHFIVSLAERKVAGGKVRGEYYSGGGGGRRGMEMDL